jgi:hypothetical protein
MITKINFLILLNNFQTAFTVLWSSVGYGHADGRRQQQIEGQNLATRRGPTFVPHRVSTVACRLETVSFFSKLSTRDSVKWTIESSSELAVKPRCWLGPML